MQVVKPQPERTESKSGQQVGPDQAGQGRWGRQAQLRTFVLRLAQLQMFAQRQAQLRIFSPATGMRCSRPELLSDGRLAGQAGGVVVVVVGGFFGILAEVGFEWWSRVWHHLHQGKRATGQGRWVGRLAPQKHLAAADADRTLLG